MLDIAFIRENPDIVRAAIKNKNREGIDLDRILVLAEERKNNANEISEINRQRNVAQEARDGEAGKRLKEELKAVEEKHQATEKELVSLLIKIPNIPSADTPIGPDESGNVVIRQWGEKPQFPFAPKAHWDLGKNLGIIDGEKAAEVSGARFVYLKGDMALLEMALMRFGFDTLISEETLKKIIDGAGLTVSSKPFTPVIPPILMRSQVMNRMARLDPIDERYYFEKDDMVFVGSAEHTLGPLHMDEILKEEDLPLRYAAMTPAFRREAGAAGKVCEEYCAYISSISLKWKHSLNLKMVWQNKTLWSQSRNTSCNSSSFHTKLFQSAQETWASQTSDRSTSKRGCLARMPIAKQIHQTILVASKHVALTRAYAAPTERLNQCT